MFRLVKKIKDFDYEELKICVHPEHNPPTLYYYTPGEYEHTCLGCGKVTKFTIYPHLLNTAQCLNG